jgi:hypothetical protein
MTLVAAGQIAIVDVNDGLSAQLTSNSISLPATEAGVVSNYTGAETTFSIYEGGTDTSSTWTYYVSAITAGIAYRDFNDSADRTGTGVTSGLLDSNYLKITSLTVALGYVDITASKAGLTSITRRYSVSRAATGVTGVRGTITGVKSVAGLNAWSDGEANNAVAGFVTSGTTSPIKGDTITLINTAGTFSETRIYSGAAWLTLAAYIATSQIVNNAITADKLAVNSVTASKIIISDLSNIVKNPIFANGATPSLEGWGGQGSAGTAILATDSSVPTGAPAATVLKLPVSATGIYDMNVGTIDVTAGEQYYAECWVATSSDAVVSGGCGIQVTVLDRNNANPSYPSVTSVPGYPQSISTVATTWTRLIAQIIVPATAGSGTAPGKLLVRFSLRAQPTAVGSVFMTKMVIRKLVNGELIVDGSITTNKMVANTINADRLLVNTITGDKIAANTISANRLLVGDTTNMVENNDFTKGKFSWSDLAGILSEPANAYNGNTFVAKYAGTGTYVNRNSDVSPCAPGEVLYLSGIYKTSTDYTTNSTGVGFRLSYLNAAGAEVGTPTLTTTIVVAAWSTIGNFFTVPAGASQVRAELITFGQLTGTVYWGYVSLRRGSGVTIENGAITAAKINGRAITAQQIATGTLVTELMTSGTINADRLLAGSITGDRIAANTISATNIGVGDFTNLIANGDLSNGVSSWQAGTVLLDAANAYNGEKYVVVRPPSAAVPTYMSHNVKIPVLPGEEYWFEWYGRATADVDGPSNPYMRINNGAGSQIGTPNVGSITKNDTAWTGRAGKFVIPPNGTEMYMQLSSNNTVGSFYYGYFSLRRRNTGVLIVDGAISATHLAVDSVTANAIKAGTISADKLVTNSISANTLTLASRPFSTIGLNLRVDMDGWLRWDDGFVVYQNEANSYTQTAVPAGAAGTPGDGVPLYITWAVGASNLQYTTTGSGLNDSRFKHIATWVGGSKKLTLAAGVGSILNGDQILTGSINADRIVARSIKADQLDTNSVTADKILANSITANKLSIASRPVSTIGINMRTAVNGNLEWDAGGVQYPDENGNYVYQPIVGNFWSAANEGEYFYVAFQPGNQNLLVGTDTGILTNPDYKYIASWQKSTKILALQAGVATLINGDKIITGSVNADRLVARSIVADNLAANSITGDKIKANEVSANKLTAATRPFSAIGLNMRIESNGNCTWDTATVYYQKNDGSTVSGRTIAAGAAGPNQGIVRFYYYVNDAGANTNLDVVINNGLNLEGHPDYKLVAIWKGGADLTVAAGVGTSINGDNLVTGTVNANRLVARSIVAGNIKAGEITGNELKAGTITADKIQTGTIGAAQIAAGAIVATKLSVGNSDNIIDDPDMRDLGYWGFDATRATVEDQNTNWNFRRRLRIFNGAGGFDISTPHFTIEPGATYKITRSIYLSPDFKGWYTPCLHIPNAQWLSLKNAVNGGSFEPANANATMGFVVDPATGSALSMSDITTIFTSPNSTATKSWQVRNVGNFTAGYIEFMIKIVRVSDSTLIQDGAITTTKMVANSINGDRITAGTLSADKISANTIISGSITVGGVSGTNTIANAFNTASWTGVTGTGKPADNATVGAPAGTLVNGVAVANITTAISAITDDNILSPSEKPAIWTEWQRCVKEEATLYTRATEYVAAGKGARYSVETRRNTLSSVNAALGNIINAYNPPITNYTANTAIDGAALRTAFANFYSNVELLRVSLQQLAAESSDWGQTYGTGKPADNATVGAPAGTSVNGVAVEAITSAISAITSDNIISPAEKTDLYNLWQRMVKAENNLYGRASEYINAGKGGRYGVQTKRDALSVAAGNLSGYINSFGPALTSWEEATPVNGANLRALFDAYNANEEPLRVALQTLASESGDWQQLYGTGKPENYTLMARSNQTTPGALPPNYAHGLRGSNGEVFVDSYNGTLRSDSYSRSYTVCWRVNSTYWAVRHFDVYGNGEVAYADNNNRKGAAGMAAQLNELGVGTIVVIYTSDEPSNQRLTSGLADAMYRCGASRTTFGGSSFNSYSSYTLVGTVGIGEGNGMEMLSSGGPNSYVMGSFSVVNNVAMIGGKTLKDATDITFSDGRGVNALIGVQAGATVGAPSGTTIGNGTSSTDIESRANNPAATVNAGGTQIDAGKIVISGGTSLANWRNGNDSTKIEGGSIAANTIKANSITLGNRGITIENIIFEVRNVNGYQELCWDAGGYIIWNNSNGNLDNRPINGGNTYGVAKRCYVFWVEYENFLRVTNDYATANAQSNVVLATYQGGTIFVANYGGTIISGDRISTGSINADKITAGTITASKLLMAPSMESIIPDPAFQDANYWSQGGQIPGVSMIGTNASWPAAPTNLLSITPPDTAKRTWYTPMFPVEAGATYRIRYYYYANISSGNFNAYIHMPGIMFLSLKNGVSGDPAVWDGNTVFSNTGGVASKEITITNSPNDSAKTWQFRFDAQFTGNIQVFCTITRVSDGTLIADGAITTNKIRVGELNGDRIQAGTLDAGTIKAYTVLSNFVQIGGTGLGAGFDIGAIALAANDPANRINNVGTTINGGKITTGSIDTLQLAAGAITADKIRAGAITADKLQIGSTSGARLTLVNNLISGYYDNNQLSFRLGTW